MRMDTMTQPRGKIPTIQAKPVRSVSEHQAAKLPDGQEVRDNAHHTEPPASTERSGAPARPPERLYSGW